jgi:hypothetical protein
LNLEQSFFLDAAQIYGARDHAFTTGKL